MTLNKCKLKSFLLSIFSLVIAFTASVAAGSMFAQAADTAGTSLLGDVDKDGQISIKDVTCIQRIVAAFPVGNRYSQQAADVDASGDIGIKDATYVQMWLANIDTLYPIGEPLEAPTEKPTEPPTQMPTDDEGWGRTIFQP